MSCHLKNNVVISAALFSVLLLPSSHCSVQDETETCERDSCVAKPANCKIFDPKNFGPKNKTIIYGEARGRIGNQLLGYALMLQLRRQLDVDSYIDATCRDLISETFTPENVEVPVFKETFCNPQDIPFEPFNGRFADLLTDEQYRRGRILDFYPTDKDDFLKGGYKPEEHQGPEQEAFQLAYVKYLKANLKFKPHIMTRVRKTLKKIAKQMGLKTKEVTYVGIHNRRTDHFELVRKLSGQEPLPKSYFYDAMDYFREEYENVAFLFISDDMAWGKKNIKNKNKDLFFVGAGENLDKSGKEIADPDAAPFDLALLTHCNHTIISRGTYSMWAALLAGGEYYTEYGSIVPTHLQ